MARGFYAFWYARSSVYSKCRYADYINIAKSAAIDVRQEGPNSIRLTDNFHMSQAKTSISIDKQVPGSYELVP